LLLSGKVLVAGGFGYSDYLASAELYNPASNSWTAAGTLATARYFHTATLLPSGKVLVAGGYGNSGILDSAELYDPASDTWSAAGTLATARENHTATLLPSGKVLVAGGNGNSGALNSAELYDPASNAWTAAAPLAVAREDHTATLLLSGKVLVAGGHDGTGGALYSAELYDPGLAPVAVLRPVLDPVYISSTNNALIGASPGSAVDNITGAATATGFMPRGEASGGSTNNSATNYPVFQVQRIDNGQMRFIPNDESLDTTDTAFISAADAFVGFPPGPMLVRAWVNGVPGVAQYVSLQYSDVIFRNGFETTP